MTRRFVIPGIIAAALIHTVFVTKMIWDRAHLLRNGTEVVLQSGFIDPRELFRGHYARLTLAIEQSEAEGVTLARDFNHGDVVYAELARDNATGFWIITSVHAEPPPPPAVALRGAFRSASPRNVRISFPVDRYFADRDRAIELENLERDRRLGVVVAVNPDGTAAIKGLSIDGVVTYDQPLF